MRTSNPLTAPELFSSASGRPPLVRLFDQRLGGNAQLAVKPLDHGECKRTPAESKGPGSLNKNSSRPL